MSIKGLIISCLFVIVASAQGTPPPFWKKPKNYTKIVDHRAILVSANTVDSGPLNEFRVITAGHINAPLDFSYKRILEFENYKKISSNFEEVKYFPENKRLFIHGSALGWHAKMIMQLKFKEEEKLRVIDWEVVDGHFKGMTGAIKLEAFKDRTEISLDSLYRAETIPLPKVLMGVGLEIVAKKVAGLMRTYIEDQYKGKK